MRIMLREIAPGDGELIAGIAGGPAWRSDAALWGQYLLDHKNGKRIVLLAFDQGKPAGYGALKWVSEYGPFLSAGIPEVSDLVVASHALKARYQHGDRELEQRARGAGKPSIGLGVGLYAPRSLGSF